MKRFLLLAALLTACAPNVETRGHLKDADWKSQIVIGQSTRDQVLEVLGSPSSRSSFGPDTWYYISTQRENFGFMRPEITGEDVTRITFDTDGTVKSIDNYDKSTARDIAINDRETPTEGHSLTFIEQLLGNVGRFNAPGSTGPNKSRPGQP